MSEEYVINENEKKSPRTFLIPIGAILLIMMLLSGALLTNFYSSLRLVWTVTILITPILFLLIWPIFELVTLKNWKSWIKEFFTSN